MESTPLIRMGRRVNLRVALWLTVAIVFLFMIWMRRETPKANLDWRIASKEEILVEGRPVTKEWMEVSADAVLPAGLDIEVDMTTHRKRVRLPQETGNSLLPVEQDDFSDPLNKMGRVYAAHKTIIDEHLEALKDPSKRQEALAYLEAQGGNVNIGAGLIRSPYFGNLVSLMEGGTAVRAADIVFSALHNNPTAIAFVYRTPLIKELLGRMGDRGMPEQAIKRMLGTLAAIFRFDLGHTPRQFMAEQGKAVLEKLKAPEMVDRVLSCLLALLDGATSLTKEELRALAELADQVIGRTGVKGHADWLEHSFKPYCHKWPDAIKGLNNLNNFCLFLTSQ